VLVLPRKEAREREKERERERKERTRAGRSWRTFAGMSSVRISIPLLRGRVNVEAKERERERGERERGRCDELGRARENGY